MLGTLLKISFIGNEWLIEHNLNLENEIKSMSYLLIGFSFCLNL